MCTNMIIQAYKDEDWEDDTPDISDNKTREYLAQLAANGLDLKALVTVRKKEDEDIDCI